jgi:hypothetical protein
MLRVLWVLMMVVWLAGLGYGLWWVWPHVERGQLTGDLVASVVWIVIGAAAWGVALNTGLRWLRSK